MKKIRINELARELEVKAHEILERLPELGVTEKKTHSSSIDEDVAIRLRRYYGHDVPDFVPEAEEPEVGTEGAPEEGPTIEAGPGVEEALASPEPAEAHAGPATSKEASAPSAGVEVEKPAAISGGAVAPIRPPLAGRPIHPPIGGHAAPRHEPVSAPPRPAAS